MTATTTPYTFLRDFWQHDFTAVDLVAYRSSPDRHGGYLEAVQARMTVEHAVSDSDDEITRCLSPCVCGELLVNIAKYLRGEGYDVLPPFTGDDVTRGVTEIDTLQEDTDYPQGSGQRADVLETWLDARLAQEADRYKADIRQGKEIAR